ncbi:MAG: IPT/TIG domain-containing protein [Candidatus Nealsonbacteria bacterium]
MLRQKRTVWENIKKSSLEKYRDALRHAKKEHINIKRLLKKEKRVFSRKIWWRICFIKKKTKTVQREFNRYKRTLEKEKKKIEGRFEESIVFIERYFKDIKKENQKKLLKHRRKIKREFLRKGKLIYESLIDFFKGAPSLLRSQSVFPQEILAFIFNNINLGLIIPIEFLISLEKDLQKIILKRRKKLEIKIDDFGLIFKKQCTKIRKSLKRKEKVFFQRILLGVCFIEKRIKIAQCEYKRYERRLQKKKGKTEKKLKQFTVFIKRYLREVKRENQKSFLKYERKILKKKKLFYKLLFNSFNNLSLLITIQLDQVIKTLVFVSDSILLNLVDLTDTLNLILEKQTRKVLLRYRCEYKKILRKYGREYRKYEGKLLKKSKKILLKNKSLTLRFVRKKVKIIERQFKKYERKLEQKKIKTEQKAEIYIALFEASYKELRKENRKKFLKYKRGLKRIISKKRKEIVIGIIRLFLDVFYYRNLFVEIINDEKELFRKLLDSIGEKILNLFDFVEWYQREFRCFVISNGSYLQKFKSWFTKITQPSFVFLKTTSFPRIKIAKIVKNSSGNFLIVWLIFLLVAGWVFSGWPRIWQEPPVPPEIKIARAASEGPNSPSSAVEDTTGIGTVSWTGYTNVYASDDSRATASLDKAIISYYIKATGFGFSIPTGATINGIEVEIERSEAETDGNIKDNSVKIVKGGTISGDEKADTVTAWPTNDADAYATYGGSTDLWGVSWTAEDINSADFGVAIAAKNTVPGKPTIETAQVDHIRITVTYTPFVLTTTIANGTDPSNATIAPGASIIDIDSFTFQTNAGTDSITAVTTTLSAGSSEGISEIRITSDDGTTLYFNAVSNPASDTIGFSGGTPIPASTTATQFKIRITPKTHANMPVPPGSDYTVTGTITAWTSTNEQSGTDTGSATITIDNQSPANVTDASGSAGDTQVSLNWTNPVDADLDSIVVLRATSTVTDTPVEGTTYTVGNTIGTSTVACIATSTETSCTDTGLTNGIAYHYKIFTKDTNGNYSATGVVPTGSPFTPTLTPKTTIANGTDPDNATIAPETSILDLDSFTFQTNINTDSITAATTTLSTGSSEGISEIRITSDDGATLYFSAVSNPASDTIGFSGGTPIPASTTLTQFKIRITPKTHANMPVPPGSDYTVTGTITAWTSTNEQAGTDTGSATITIDNQSPANVTSASGSAGDTQVSLNWTNSTSTDLDSTVVLRATSTVTDTPVEGTTYSVEDPIGTSIVACIATSTETSCTDTGLTNGTAYHYKIFTKDTNENYSATGVVPTGSPFTPSAAPTTYLGNGTDPSNTTVEPGSTNQYLDQFSFNTNTGTDSISALTVTSASTTAIASMQIWSDDLGTQYFTTVSSPVGDSWNFSDGTAIPVNITTAYFRVIVNFKDHVSLASGSYAVTGYVSSFTSTNIQSGSDSAGTTIIVDNSPPADATWGTITPGDEQVILNWTNPEDLDFSEVLILRSTSSPITDAPTDGSTYSAPGTIGSSDIIYVGSLQTFTDTGLTNDTSYFYKIFSRDTYKNYSGGVQTGPHTPTEPPTTSLGNGTDPGNATIAPGSSATMLDSFTFQTNTGTDPITAATTTLSAGSSGGISLIEITSDDGVSVYGSVSDPAADSVSITLTGLTASTTLTQFKIRITPKTHANMPVPPGSDYTVTGTITAWTSTNEQAGTDTGSATITIDNQSPANVTSASGSAGDTQVSLNWTNSTSTDLDSTVVLRATSTVTDTPVEGTTYSVEDPIGTSIVACIATSTETSCTDTGLTNGTAYHYKIFTKDTNENYSATGVVPTGSPFTPSAAPTTYLGNGTDPSNTTVEPGSTNQYLDQFSFNTNTGTDSISALTVTSASTTAIASMQIWSDDLGTQYFTTVSSPVGDSWNFSDGTAIPVNITTAYFRVIVNFKDHVSLASGSYAVTGYVSSFTSTNIQSGSDSAGTTIIVDNSPPADATWGTITPGDEQVILNWTNPEDLDFSEVLILRSTSSPITDAPTDGSTYSAPGTIGSSDIIYVGSLQTFTDTGLTNDTSYFYKIFSRDTYKNYSGGVQTGPHTPTEPPTTSLGNGTDPGNATIAPGSSATMLDSFTFQTNTGTDPITAATTTLSAGSSGGISLIEITSDDGVSVYGSVSDPAADSVSITLTGLTASTTLTQFKIRITPKTHANMPVPPGSDYTVTGTITAWTSTNEQSGTDTGSATITIDNQSPANVTDASGSAGDTQVSLNWTNPVDADLDSTVVLRATTTVTDTPVEGTTYTVGNTIGTSTVACIATSTETSCTDTGLTNGIAYHYKIFTKDTNGNYSATGVVPTGSPFTPQTTLTIGVTSGPKVGNLDSGATSQYINDTGCNTSSTCAAFTLSISFGSETITSIKITETGTAAADTYLSNLALFYDTDDNFSNGTTGQYGTTVANFAADQTANVSGSLVVSSDTTYYFYVRFDVVNGANYPTGGQTVNFQIAVDADVGTTGTPNKTGAPATLAGITSIRPDVTSIAYPQSPDGGRNGDTFTISGVGFATSCTNVSVQIQTTDLTCNSAATTSLSVTIPVAQTTTFGGTGSNGLLVTVGGTADDVRQDFFIYPKIDSITVPTGFASSTAREFQSGDTDGIITLNGSRFGTNGTVTVLGQSATTTSYADTAVELQIPTSISDNVYTGDIVLTRTNPSDNKTVTSTNFRILPRIISLIPNNGLEGDAVTISGNHFCQTGTCPPSGQRNTSTSTITFNGVNVPDSDVTAWSDASIEVKVPTGATTGLVIVKSNNFTSNGLTFSVGVPDATSFINNTEGGLLDGGRPGQSITVTGTYFASACSAPSTEVKIGTYSVPCSDVSNWTATSVTFTIPTSTTAYGGSGSDGLIIRADDQDDQTPLTFFVYPKVTNIVTPLISGAAREGETITLTSLRFGTTGTVTILGENAAISSWQDTSVSVVVPSSIADNNYTGTVILMRSSPSGNKSHTATSSFRILPRITSLNPNSGEIGDPVQILGNHFCQTGTCPAAGSKSTSTDNVKFYNAIQVSDANVTAWSDTQIDVKVPSGAETGNVVIRSNDYDSNGVSFTVSEVEEPPPAAPPPSGGIYIYIGDPIAVTPKAISQETIRWYFIDTATDETGFKLYIKQNGYYKEIVSSSTPDLEFLNEAGLSPNTRYSKRYVRAFRDSWYSNLSGEFSAVYTLIEEPTVLKLKQRTGNNITVELVVTLSNLTSGNSGLFFENVTLGTNSGWVQVDFWTSDNLKPGATYNFRVKARNGDGIETSFSPIYSFSSLEEEVPPVVPPFPPEEEIIPPEVPTEEVVLPPSPLQRVQEVTEDTLDLIKDVILKTIEIVQDIESFIKETFTQTTQDISDTAKDVVLKTTETVQDIEEIFTQTTQDISDTAKDVVLKTTETVQDIEEIFTQTTQDISDATRDVVSKVIKTVVSTYNKVVSRIKRILPPEKEIPPLVVPRYVSPQPTLIPKDIPFDTLIAKSSFGNISLQLGPEGRFNLLAGASFKAFIRPSKPVTSITGKILFETTADIPFINLISFLGDVAQAGQEAQAKILLVQEYVFQDPDKDGIYTASISIPPVPGDYIIKTSLSYIDGELKEIENQTLVDPRGYIYRLDPDGLKARIINAIVTIHYFNPYTEQYELWSASAYDQKNPQITDDTGEYAFFVPEGKYYLTVSAKNYSFYQSEEFFISEGVFIHKNIELKHEGGFWNMIKRGFNR